MQKHFNQYRLSKQIASKPSGSVYLAHRVNHASQKVVLELFETRHFTSNQQSENFLQKAKRIKQLSHPFILPIQDLGIEQGYPYTVRKYLGNDSLHRRLDRLSPQRLSLPEALTIIFQVGQAISYAHQHNVLHGNLKPENIFFNHDDEILLTDFDLANFIDLTKSDIKADLQTVSYLAPEQFVGSTTEKSDQYALGCLSYKLITGRVPFSARDFSSMWAKQSTEPPIPLSDLVPNLPKPIEEIVLKAMAKDPSERYANVSLFVSALQIISTLATSVVSSPLVAPSSNTLIMAQTRPPESITNQTPLAKPLHATQLDTDPAVAQSPHTTTLSDTDPLVAKSLHEASLAMRLTEHPAYEYNENKALMTPPGNPLTEALPKGRPPQSSKPLAPTLWLAFALSGVILLLGTVILYALVPSRSPSSIKPVKSSPTSVTTPAHQAGLTSLIGSYAEQTNQIYNLTNEGTLDWIYWGLNAPGDVNHKRGVQQQISTFTIIGSANHTGTMGIMNNNGNNINGRGNYNGFGNGFGFGFGNGNYSGVSSNTVQRVSYNSNAKIQWSDGTPVATAQPQQASGIYVTGANSGFSFSAPASTTPRTLRVYVGANGARGQLTASLNGKTYIDETLNTTYNSNGPQGSGIYTLVFNSNTPNQILTIEYTAITSNSSNGYVMLEAATLH